MRTVRCLVLALLAAAGPLAALAQSTVVRDTEFEYDPETGLLTLERIDPGKVSCLETRYTHDAYGNRLTVKTQPCGDNTAARFTRNYFASGAGYPAGAYQTRSVSGTANGDGTAVGTAMAETRATFDARFGTALTQTEVALADGTKSLTQTSLYDGLGRLSQHFVPASISGGTVQNTSVRQQRFYCLGALANPPGPGCLNITGNDASLSVSVTYASQRLTNGSGEAMESVAVKIVSAYYLESTPIGTNGQTVIGARTRVHYDSLHRQIAKETQSYDGRWVRTLTGYDALGQVAATWGAHFVSGTAPQAPPPRELRQWTAARDNLHRPTDQRQFWRGAPSGQNVVTELQATVTYLGLRTKATVPATSAPNNIARTVRTDKNPVGQTTRTVNADGATLDMAYDAAGNLVKTVDALGHETTITYTPGTARFKTGMVDPDQGNWQYGYDAFGQLRTQTDARGKTITMDYDALGRLVSKNTGDLNASWYHAKREDGSWCAWGLNRPCENKTGNTATVTRQSLGYDALGRATSSAVTLDRVYTSSSAFDSEGRLSRTTYPTGFAVDYAYSSGAGGKVPGVLEKVSDAADATRVFWRVDTLTAAEVFDAQGHLLKAKLGNGVVTDHVFDPVSGKAFHLRGGTGSSNANVFDQRYTYDKANNLATRTEGLSGVVETFAYDVLDRLTRYELDSASDAGAAHVVTTKYNALGNVLEKGDVGGYAYSAVLNDKPHAVRSAGGSSYSYDANGNVLSATGVQSRTHVWTDFNQPATLAYGGKSVAFSYDAGYKRVKEVVSEAGKVRTLYLVHPDNAGGLGYEREETRVNGSLTRNENRHYIGVAGVVVAVVKTLNSGDPVSGQLNGVVSSDLTLTQYWHKDALGSIVAVSDAALNIERMAFDAWGRRQRDTGRVDAWVNPAHGDRGYTGHEHLDELALVHMNGRVYDPLLARFLSPDPVLQAPEDLQNYNRFSYVLNNPVRYTDPTGQCFGFLGGVDTAICGFVIVASTAMAVSGNKYWSMVGQMWMMAIASPIVEAGLGVNVVGPYGPQLPNTFNVGGLGNAFVAAAGTTFIVSNGDLGQALQEGLFAALTSYVGGVKNDGLKVMGHALVGCARGAATGGKCGPSAMAGAFSKIATIAFEDASGPVHITASVVAGGTASVIGGGKFINGAGQAAFVYLFNYCSSGKCTTEFEQFMYDWWPGYKAGTLLYNQTMGDGSWTGWEVLDAGSVGLGVAAKGVSLGLSGGSRSVFWSGWGAKSEAANLGITLETTPVGRVLDFAQGKGWLGDGAISRWIWNEASATFAGNATGQAQTVIRFNSPGSVFYRTELPILQRNGVPIQSR
ncbi:RHS repeat-associated core domain-containing protein [Piscinibacter defluvii]|uniref:RHS repeat-associated core domain-containing protein n=1 Tax=Piscinibacter defluvii TaxID=1796922 RepID=UPI000FDEEADB|nr:RHS repeat-associated core domain-containing protein [Piscinibacter defluvii]